MGVQPRRHHCPSRVLLARNHLRKINSTMSETEATAAPTAEEIKGTKRAAEDDVDLAKKQKTENGANGSNGAAKVAEENGAEVEEEDEEALGEEEEGEGEEDLDEEAEGEEGEEEEDGEGEEEEEGDD